MATNFITDAQLNKLVALYVGYFNRAPEADGINYWSQELLAGINAGKTEAAVLTEIANAFYDAGVQYNIFSSAQTVQEFIAVGYANALGRTTVDADGMAYWTTQLTSGAVSRGEFIQHLISDAYSFAGDATWGWVATYMNNRVAVGNYFADNSSSLSGTDAITAGTNALKVVTPATAQAGQTAEQAIATLATVAPVTLDLTVGQDNLVGTLGNDLFVANVVQNAAGEQTNQLATGDKITGGSGIDTLTATVQKASALNGSPTQAITPTTTGVEKALFTALTVDNTAATNAGETVVINAKNMDGLTQVGSVESDASLTIQNLTTLTETGNYADRRDTSAVTIRMDHTGNDAALDKESDLTVLFDNDYLKSDSLMSSKTFWYLLDQGSNMVQSTPLWNKVSIDPATNLPYARPTIDSDGLKFTINGGAEKTVKLTDAEFKKLDGTWPGFVAALNEQLKLDAKTDTSLAGFAFSLDDSAAASRVIKLPDGTASYVIPAIVLTSANGEDVTSTGFHHYDSATGAYAVYGQVADSLVVVTELPVVATIELEKVGRGAEGGDLTVGGMATDFANEWNYSNSAIKEGVDQFNITVSGDQTQFSDLASLQSTNNTLVNVDVKWAAGSVADLIIGNHNTEKTWGVAAPNGATGSDDDVTTSANNALKDVRDFTATNTNTTTIKGTVYTNDVTVNAYLSDEVVAKYMNLADNGLSPVNDNAQFDYIFGAGSDTLNINLSKTNLAQSGTTNREDFKFIASMGAGNDTVATQIGDGTGVASDAWFINSNLNKNLVINTEAGNDTVRTFGAGTWTVDLGANDDVIYSDNSGNQNNGAIDLGTDLTDLNYNSGRSVWVLNTADQVSTLVADSAERSINNLVSDANGERSLYAATLRIDLNGVYKDVVIGDYNTTDLELNNLIKAAIKGDTYLSKLIVAEDGPSNTLVIRSLTDGTNVASDLSISVTAAASIATMNATQIADFNVQNGLTGAAALTTVAQVAAFVAADVTAFTATTDYDAALANDGANHLTGAASTAITNSSIVDGSGADVIVLSTSGIGSETVNLTNDATKDVVFNIQHATINGVHAEDLLVTATGVSYTFADLKLLAGVEISTDGLMISNIVFDNGIPGGGGGTPTQTPQSIDALSTTTTEVVFTTAGAFYFTDDVTKISNLKITTYDATDTLRIVGSTAAAYAADFSSTAAGDVVISHNEGGILSVVTLVGVAVGTSVYDVASFNALAVGDIVFA